ncbi:MAG: riboflavin biosynthesis protein RibD [Alphaproteobacteria bacterium CG11_big_fil_rev_8_21_14_0_20_44_7]|nr:MAG: riboflavin biosynthesis protein RibD [Alphaproteobacteria bacterium CG11_big_fil_rev_8_21_14_0_20_44_7]
MQHHKYMKIALELAKRGLGQTHPNPSVGCVIVKNNEIIASACTAKNGRPHAEFLALKQASKKAQNATAYVTLEPCAHEGETPSCARLLAEAGIKLCVIAVADPDKRTNRKGIKALQKAGVEVISEIYEKEAAEINRGFIKKIKTGLPYVMLKVATSADGKFLHGNGQPQWVTGELARNYVQLLRTQYDVILTSTKTILDDDPQLNCRLPGLQEISPVKAVIGTSKIPHNSRIFAGNEVWLYDKDLKATLKAMAGKGITRVMVEAGSKLANNMLRESLVDSIYWFKSAESLGKGEEYFTENLENFTEKDSRIFSEDRLAILEKI